jgi:hypothetical protein
MASNDSHSLMFNSDVKDTAGGLAMGMDDAFVRLASI